MRNIYTLLLIFTLLSCHKKQESTATNVSTTSPAIIPEPEEFYFDKDKTFGVYRITQKEYAIVRNVQFDNPDFPLSKDYEFFLKKDSIPWIYGKPMRDYEYYDSITNPNLIYNARFEKEFLPKMKSTYFIYGKKGIQQCRVKKVIFKSSECGNDYIAYILDVDVAKTGTPLVASENKMPLQYGANYSGMSLKYRNFLKKMLRKPTMVMIRFISQKYLHTMRKKYFLPTMTIFWGTIQTHKAGCSFRSVPFSKWIKPAK